jgi:hypothetical protein
MAKVKLNPGDIYCPRCGGAGRYEKQKCGEWTFSEECNTCLGAGKLDWIEQVVGKPRKKWIEFDLSKEVQASIAKDLAEEIDKEILESLYKEAEQIKKEDIDGNRIIPKFLLHTSSKQIIKSQKNQSFIQRNHRRSKFCSKKRNY